MENENTRIEELFYKFKDYGETTITLLKLKAINKILKFSSTVIVSIFSMIFLFLILICASIGFSLLIGQWLGHTYWGFFIIALVYIIIWLLLFLSKKKILNEPIKNKLIKELID